jgi:hypothetical protein
MQNVRKIHASQGDFADYESITHSGMMISAALLVSGRLPIA